MNKRFQNIFQSETIARMSSDSQLYIIHKGMLR